MNDNTQYTREYSNSRIRTGNFLFEIPMKFLWETTLLLLIDFSIICENINTFIFYLTMVIDLICDII